MDTPSVHVTDYSVQIHAPLAPDPRTAAKGDAAGLPGMVPALTEACLALPEVKKWHVLGEQVAAAERRVATAERTFKQVAAAKVLLEENPEPDLAEKLRAIEGQLAAAQADRAAAAADLDTIKHLVPKLWADAANAVRFHASQAMLEKLMKELTPRQAAAEAKLAAAVDQLKATVAAAVADLIAGPVADLAVAKHAHLKGWDRKDRYVTEVLAAAVGPKPAGVCQDRSMFELEPPPAPKPAPPKPVAPVAPNPIRIH